LFLIKQSKTTGVSKMLRQARILIFLFAFLFILSIVNQAQACSCIGRQSFGKNFQPACSYWSADVVFIGLAEKVEIVEVGTTPQNKYSKMVVKFSVEKAIRGVEGKTVEVETSPSTASCGYRFKQGERYFAYFRRDKDGILREHLCGPTVLLENAEADLEYLRAIERGETGGRVFGSASQITSQSLKMQNPRIPLADIVITLKSVKTGNSKRNKSKKYKKRKFSTLTDKDGFYLFKEIPEGLYIVEADLPEGFRELRPKKHYVSIDKDRKRYCRMQWFLTTSLGSIEGRA
jgi:hypothetical protein